MSANYSPATIFATKFSDLLHRLLKRSVGIFGRCIGYTATKLCYSDRVPVQCIDPIYPSCAPRFGFSFVSLHYPGCRVRLLHTKELDYLSIAHA